MGLGLDNSELADIRSIISIVIKGAGWLLLALFVGALVATRLANGLNGIALGGGSLLGGAILGRWVGRRWVLKSARYFWIPAILLLVAGLVVSVRNTPLAIAPIHIVALATAGLALAVALAGVLRYQGRAAMWRSVLVVVASLGALVLIGLDATISYRTETVVVSEDTALSAMMSVPRGDGPFPVVLFVDNASSGLRSAWRAPADFLARRGYITVIWEPTDDGEGEPGATRDLAPDLASWVTKLQERTDVDPDRIALWGVGEDSNSIVSAAVMSESLAAIVLTSPAIASVEPFRDFDGSVLVAYGTDDVCAQLGAGGPEIGDTLGELSNHHLSLAYPDSGSGLLVWLNGETSCGVGLPPVSYPPDYLDTVVAWLSESLQSAR